MRERIGRYRLTGVLGEGGMGVVYAAEDEVLGRRVAIKTVRPDLGDATQRERLWREARAAAGLTHPNICQVHDVGEEDGELYVAMELLEGEPLSARLERGPLPLDASLRVGLASLAALEALHGRAVIHRDLKPSNVFLTATGTKLLDFGLALPLDEALQEDAERLTQTGVILGTPGFMAPEQWTGEEVGPRTDVFAAGALLFEMVTGSPAFQGKGPLALYHAVLHESPPTLTGGPAVDALDRIVQRALARDPAERYASAADMAADLRTVQPLVEGSERAQACVLLRLLVLPFEQVRPDDASDLMTLGLVDSIVSALAGRRGLVVKAGREALPADALAGAAHEHGAHLVVTGSVLHAGSQLRVSARLVGVHGEEVAWSASVTVNEADAFREQEALANQVASAVMERTATPTNHARRARVPAAPEAYALYLRANQQSYNFGLLGEARDLYREALAIDPDFAPAWARLGRVLRVRAKYGHGDPARERKEAEAAFRKALELDPQLAVAHNLYAYYEIEELGRPSAALERLLTQARLAPTDPDLFAGLVTACRFCGLLEPSVEADRRARRLDPGMRTSVAYTLWMRGSYESALAHDDEDMRWIHHYALPMLGRADEALTLLRACEARAPRPTERDMFTSSRAALEGDREAAVAATHRVFASSFSDPEGLYFMVRNMARLGETDLAIDGLERVVAGGLHAASTIESDPWLDQLRADDRFVRVLEASRRGHAEARAIYDQAGGAALLGPVMRASPAP